MTTTTTTTAGGPVGESRAEGVRSLGPVPGTCTLAEVLVDARFTPDRPPVLHLPEVDVDSTAGVEFLHRCLDAYADALAAWQASQAGADAQVTACMPPWPEHRVVDAVDRSVTVHREGLVAGAHLDVDAGGCVRGPCPCRNSGTRATRAR